MEVAFLSEMRCTPRPWHTCSADEQLRDIQATSARWTNERLEKHMLAKQRESREEALANVQSNGLEFSARKPRHGTGSTVLE